jgi:hypothetical protein
VCRERVERSAPPDPHNQRFTDLAGARAKTKSQKRNHRFNGRRFGEFCRNSRCISALPHDGPRAIFNKEGPRADRPSVQRDAANRDQKPHSGTSDPRALEAHMRRILVTAGLMAGLIGATTVPAAAQGWGYAAYDEPWGGGVGVSVGGVGVGIGAPAYGAYAARLWLRACTRLRLFRSAL